jgi:hypothetical protein
MMAWLPYFAMMSFQREVISAVASSQEMRVNWREPHSVGIVVVFVVVLQLHAKRAAGHRMILIPAHLHERAVLDLVDHGAGVGTVMRTPAEERFACRLIVNASSPP